MRSAVPSLRRLITSRSIWICATFVCFTLLQVQYYRPIISSQDQSSPAQPLNGSSSSSSASTTKGIVYSHDNINLPESSVCTEEQTIKISTQLELTTKRTGISPSTRCPDPTWLEGFYSEEQDIGSEKFLGISVGCNKGHDAIRSARMGTSDPSFDVPSWVKSLGGGMTSFACRNENEDQPSIVHPTRDGEMHCVEPMPSTFQKLNKAAVELGLRRPEGEGGLVLTQAVISARNGEVLFPRATAGTENLGIGACKQASKCDAVEKCLKAMLTSLWRATGQSIFFRLTWKVMISTFCLELDQYSIDHNTLSLSFTR
eukprot:g14868.t1 g14868   contig21:46715-47844(+)